VIPECSERNFTLSPNSEFDHKLTNVNTHEYKLVMNINEILDIE
jgi:hypothetical protein